MRQQDVPDFGINIETGEAMGYRWPGTCNHPNCGTDIDHGLTFVCGGKHLGGKYGCGRYFCFNHLTDSELGTQLCKDCFEKAYPPQDLPVARTGRNTKRRQALRKDAK
jgi:hypothetical protein